MFTNMAKEQLIEKIALEEKTEAVVTHGAIRIKGQKGESTSKMAYPKVTISKEDGYIVLKAPSRSKPMKRIIYTYASHIRNMIHGAHEGYVYKLKICSGHFPMTAKVEGHTLVISNFLGEKTPRKALILDDVKVTVAGEVISVESVDLNKAGQTAANIEIATKIRNRDRRVFQDGIHLIEKPE